MQSDKEKELLAKAKSAAEQMEDRVLSGEVINDVVNEDGERILVTKTSSGMYGYAVFRDGKKEPFYVVEGSYLLTDLNKKTTYHGFALKYPGAKSMIQRNMVGIFSEYIKDPGFEGYYISMKMPDAASADVAQRMSGYDPQDVVTLFEADFYYNRVCYASDVEVLVNRSNRFVINIGVCTLKSNGMPDYEKAFRYVWESYRLNLSDNQRSKSNGGVKLWDVLRVQFEQNIDSAMSVFYQLYQTLGLPIKDGIVPSDLLAAAMAGKDISKYLAPDGSVLSGIVEEPPYLDDDEEQYLLK